MRKPPTSHYVILWFWLFALFAMGIIWAMAEALVKSKIR